MKYFFDDNKLHISAIHFCVIAFVPANFIRSNCFNHHDTTKTNSWKILALLTILLLFEKLVTLGFQPADKMSARRFHRCGCRTRHGNSYGMTDSFYN
jgi:hypothetical protein